MPAPLTIAARRAMVEELRRQEPDISARKIAARLGVGKDAIRRDLDAIETDQRQRATVAAAAAPDPEPPAPGGAPEEATLVLVLDEPLRQALAVLRATQGGADTEAANRSAARAAIRAMADIVLEAGLLSAPGTEGEAPE
ncbi:HTH domain-containing protein [Streptomyces mirabilis]|uniref:HTH domain-containing protein n=1 Tax=Streptomyces sp. NPDC005388 TaxID=3156717 RepID=UPI0033ADBDA2